MATLPLPMAPAQWPVAKKQGTSNDNIDVFVNWKLSLRFPHHDADGSMDFGVMQLPASQRSSGCTTLQAASG